MTRPITTEANSSRTAARIDDSLRWNTVCAALYRGGTAAPTAATRAVAVVTTERYHRTMTDAKLYAGGCLCGAVRYEARGEPRSQGYCFCSDCRKASGSGFVPFLSFAAASVRFSGATTVSIAKSARGGDAVRNHCARCGGLVFGGIVGSDSDHTIYAGSLDEPSLFHPTIALFARDKPAWVPLPAGLTVFDAMPAR